MEKNNKIIAEFMGVDLPYKNDKGNWEFYVKDAGLINSPNIEDLNRFLGFNYHFDWNWLIKVVEKIESIKDPYHGRFGVYISSNSCTIQSTNFRPDKPIPNPPHYYDNVVLNNKIDSVYNAVVRFINFYNKQEEEVN